MHRSSLATRRACAAKNASLRPRRSPATWENAGPHSAEPSIPDEEGRLRSTTRRRQTARPNRMIRALGSAVDARYGRSTAAWASPEGVHLAAADLAG
jgi:hypothetical protein